MTRKGGRLGWPKDSDSAPSRRTCSLAGGAYRGSLPARPPAAGAWGGGAGLVRDERYGAIELLAVCLGWGTSWSCKSGT